MQISLQKQNYPQISQKRWKGEKLLLCYNKRVKYRQLRRFHTSQDNLWTVHAPSPKNWRICTCSGNTNFDYQNFTDAGLAKMVFKSDCAACKTLEEFCSVAYPTLSLAPWQSTIVWEDTRGEFNFLKLRKNGKWFIVQDRWEDKYIQKKMTPLLRVGFNSRDELMESIYKRIARDQ